MMITFYKDKDVLKWKDYSVAAWSRVRSLQNGKRKKTEVVLTEPLKGTPRPYDPVIMPTGIWNVSAPVAKTDKYLAPFFIPTAASQKVKIWSVSKDSYMMCTNEEQIDAGYGIHFSSSETTLGCIRVALKSDLEQLVKDVQHALANGEKVTLIVT